MKMKEGRGQVLILSVVSIVMVMIGVSSILTVTSLAGLRLPKQQFREDVTQVALGSRAALSSALADISKRLKNRAEITQYRNYTSYDYAGSNSSDPELTQESLDILDKWYNNTVNTYPVTGLRLKMLDREFHCNWNGSNRMGLTKARMTVNVDFLNYGFEGYTERSQIELNSEIREVLFTDGNLTRFTVRFTREEGYPVEKLVKDQILVYALLSNQSSLSKADLDHANYLGNGVFEIQYHTRSTTIPQNFEQLYAAIEAIPAENFTLQDSKSYCLSLVTTSQAKYASGRLTESWQTLRNTLRPALDPIDRSITSEALQLIDILLSQLQPQVRLVAMDSRGITVSVSGALFSLQEDRWGPMLLSALAQPTTLNTTMPVDVLLQAKADDRGYGASNISLIEYFVLLTQPQLNSTSYAMTPLVGSFDEPYEEATSTIHYGNFQVGTNYIWVRAMDSKSNYGDFKQLKVTMIQNTTIRTANITMSITWRKGPADINHYGVVQANVTIVDGVGNPVEGATVHGNWSGDISWQGNRTTLSNGCCIFDNPVEKGHGHKTYTLTVDLVYLEGYVWDHVIKTQSITD